MPITGPLINTSGEIGVILEYLTYNVTGSLFLSLLAFMFVLFALALAFRIPIEWTAVIVFPMILVLVATTTQFLPILGVFIIYLGIIVSKNFFYK